MRRIRYRSGFTLIEILIVVVIIGILATVIIPNVLDRPEEARRTKAATDIKSIEQALLLYKLDNGFYPTTEQGLIALIEKPTVGKIPKRWRSNGYLRAKSVPKDPWGTQYQFISPGDNGDYDLISYGQDGRKGGEGDDADINNWEIE